MTARAPCNVKREDWLVIGISGVTCGGKTTLAHRLSSLLSSLVLHQDHYFYPDDHHKHHKVPGLDHNNYDVLTALDMEQMYKDTLAVLEGREVTGGPSGPGVSGGVVSNVTTPGGSKLTVPGKHVLVIEGFTVLNYKPLYDLCDLRYYFILQYEECLSRRTLRLYSPPDVPGYFEKVVWPQHLIYRKQLEHDPCVTFLDGADPDVTSHVLNELKKIGAQPL